jgi:hypothetical protein
MAHRHCKEDLPETPLEDRVAALLERCRKVGLRRTHALQTILRLLLTAEKPLTTSEIAESDEMADSCDSATVYRLLTRLKAKGIVRRLGLHERSAFPTVTTTTSSAPNAAPSSNSKWTAPSSPSKPKSPASPASAISITNSNSSAFAPIAQTTLRHDDIAALELLPYR